MTDIVVDIGNSRIKWGRVAEGKLTAAVSLPHEAPTDWERQLVEWQVIGPLRWTVAGVNPRSQEALLAWVKARGDTARVLCRAAELPLVVQIPEPDKAGIDRLLAAVGANARRANPLTAHPSPSSTGARGEERPAVVVGVGTAITVDLLDARGAFLGGAIMPGSRLLALALHEHTALLPLVETIPPWPKVPATSTRAAIELGLHWAMVGGINGLIQEMGARLNHQPEAIDVFVMGGGAPLVLHRLVGRLQHCPVLVLEGIVVAMKALS